MWEETVKPDYSVLLSPKWWIYSASNTLSEESKAK
jgi:hypothetical protein